MEHIRTLTALRILQSADLMKARLAGEFSSVHGVSVSEFFLMWHLARAEMHRLPRVTLAKRMHVSASTVTRMALPMEKLGLLSRQADERDARLAFVVLTPTGMERFSQVQATFAKRANAVFRDRWTDAELDQLATLMNRLVVGFEGDLSAEG